MEFEKIITWMDWATIIVAFFAMFFTFVNWYKNIKQNNSIKIIMEIADKRITLPSTIVRKHLTRAEIFGILGAFEKDSKFDIKYLSSKHFFDSISSIQQGKEDELIIKLQKDDKFNLIKEQNG